MDIVFSFVILFCLIFSFLFQIDDFFSFFCFFSSLTSSTFLSSFSSFSSFSLSCLFRGGHTGTKAALFPSHYSFIPYPPGVYLSVCKCVCVCVCVYSFSNGRGTNSPAASFRFQMAASCVTRNIHKKESAIDINQLTHSTRKMQQTKHTHTHTHTHTIMVIIIAILMTLTMDCDRKKRTKTGRRNYRD